ncbi:uncharacterized protein LOC123427849 isoform X2 [Hordeum vulgare subsp. vulgare]|uniref:Predicted protein n=1 Tax=Hordeum vulgare subsp. vulgare TaxID=112509 RepID=F2CVR1_HORVV|nr:uncharacterized protein LOC123427849 isoform X2 [Hordeum vulgare subsp. vulgare]BAJ86932.1 predicted protein [Hordeum vulgare subsp. vulgare]
MNLVQHADNMPGNNGSGKQAVWTTAMSSFVLKFMANLVTSGTRASNSFRQVHHKSCAKALNERFKLQVSAAQISNHLRKWKRIWGRVNKLKTLSGALWDEHTCTVVLDQEHYASHVKDHHSDADLLNTPIEHYHEMATICGSGMVSGVYASRNSNDLLSTDVADDEFENEDSNGESDPLATYVTENEMENRKTNGVSDPLATDVSENEKTCEEAMKSFTNTDGGNFGDPSGSLPPPKKAKGMNMEQHADNMGGTNGGGGQLVWTNAMSSFVLQFLTNLVVGGTRPSHVFKQVNLKSCAQALSEHFRVQVNSAQISNHLRKWKKIWKKVNILKSLSGALWDANTSTIVLNHEHYTAHVKDHHHDADFLNTPIKNYREMATIFVKGMASSRPARSSNESLAREPENVIENENVNGGGGLIIAKGVEGAAMSFTNTDEGDSGDSSGSLPPPPPPKKAKVKNDDSLLCTMTRVLDRLAEAVEKCSRRDTDVPDGLWANMKGLPGFEQEHLAHYYAYLCENAHVARAFVKLSVPHKMVWVNRYIKNHLSA